MKKIIALLCCISILSGCFRMVREDGKPYQKLVKEAYIENVPAEVEEYCPQSIVGTEMYLEELNSQGAVVLHLGGNNRFILAEAYGKVISEDYGTVRACYKDMKCFNVYGGTTCAAKAVYCNCKKKVVAKAKKVKHEAQYKTAIPYTCKQKFDVPITAISLLLTWGIATLVCGVMMFDEKCPSMLNDPRCTKAGRFEEIKEIK